MTVLGDCDQDLDPGDRWVVLHGSNGEEGKKGKKRKHEKEGSTFRVPRELLFRTREEAEAHLREALRKGDDGDDGDDEGGEGGDKGERGDKGGEVGGDMGGEKEGDTGGEKGVAGSKGAPWQTPTTQEG